MKWFGDNWGAPVCDGGEHVPTPVGQLCEDCHQPIVDGDQGLVLGRYYVQAHGAVWDFFPVHLDCLMRMVGAQ